MDVASHAHELPYVQKRFSKTVSAMTLRPLPIDMHAII